jgi:oxygen-independent coproporphyrinogen III oxidase
MMSLMRDQAIGIYISVPFCRSKCTYCNFASGVYPAGEHARYVDRLIADMAGAGNWAAQFGLVLPRRVDTVYLGGGTPSLLEPELIGGLFAAMRAEFDLEAGAEITVECAPGQLAQPTLDAMVAGGVNRVSLGVQSFVDKEAHESGRLHSRAVVLEDLKRLRAAGIKNLNIDLIAGLAGQTFASWDESLTVLLDAGVPHASVYMLEVDEESRLGRELLGGGTRYRAGLVPSDDAIAQMYETALKSLENSGLAQYEISNFARAGFESRHNLRYWQRCPYLGLGLDASSMLRAFPEKGSGGVLKGQDCSRADVCPAMNRALAPEGGLRGQPNLSPNTQPEALYVLRTTTTDDLKAYLAGAEPPETAWLSPERQVEEAWFLGLRTNAGVDPAALEAEFGTELIAPARAVAASLVDDGLLAWEAGHFHLTGRGRLISNDVFQEFLAAPEHAR